METVTRNAAIPEKATHMAPGFPRAKKWTEGGQQTTVAYRLQTWSVTPYGATIAPLTTLSSGTTTNWCKMVTC